MKKKEEALILYIITKLELGGAQKVCLTLFNNIDNDNVKTCLITGKKGKLVNAVQKKSNAFLLSSFIHAISFKNLWLEARNFINIVKKIKALKKEYKTIIVHTHCTKAGLIGRWAAFFAGIKTRIHTVHAFGFNPSQNKFFLLFAYILEFFSSFITTHYVCVSSKDINIGKKFIPFFSKKYSLIRAAVDWEKFYVPAIKTSLKNNMNFAFGTVSCFKPVKNVFDLLKAFKFVHSQNPNTTLEIIGDGIQKKDIKKWIKTYNLEKIITLHGWQNNVAHYMQTWDAFVLSSLWEGLPCAVVEARLQKLPVLCYKTGGIKDVIHHNKNGLLYKTKQWQHLALGMLKISKDHSLQEKLKTYDDKLSEFNNQYMIKEHTNLYQKFLK